MNDKKAYIEAGKAVLGIEFGSTRIKAVLIGYDFAPLAMGAHDWKNKLEGGYWTYSLDDIECGIRDAYAKMAADVKAQYGIELSKLAALGISGMMHGYMPFDANGKLLAAFRTWRNTTTAKAAGELSELFEFNVPQRWSVSHFAQALIDKEAHVGDVKHLTTLAGYVHCKLCGVNALGIGEASGMFPIDPATRDYDATMLKKFEERFGLDLKPLLPKVLDAGENAGALTAEGAK